MSDQKSKKPSDDRNNWVGINLDRWGDFVSKVSWLRQKKMESGCTDVLSLLFRGDNDPNRNLETSLEREWQQPVSLDAYFKVITKIRPELESVRGARWDTVPEFDPEYRKWIDKLECPGRSPPPPGYDYLAYLRHHGFPSPFLDWSRSPYIAAYFAFARAEEGSKNRVSIYIYCEVAGDAGSGRSDRPTIISFGPYVRTHRRHFQQQSEYTVCLRYSCNPPEFAAHDEALTRRDNVHEDELESFLSERTGNLTWKFNLPASEKWNVLRYLDEHNINAYSLFASEDALVRTLAMRERGRQYDL